MSKARLQKTGELDGKIVTVEFSSRLRDGFRDLAAALHFSEHADPTMLSVVQQWAEGKKPSVQEVFAALPPLAEEVFKHTQATGDKKAVEAWSEIGGALLEPDAFTMQNHRWRTR